MVLKQPTFSPGSNIALKIPQHQFEQTLRFYRDVLGFKQQQLENSCQSVAFDFGDKTLWLDCCPARSSMEVWLEIHCDDPKAARDYFRQQQITIADEIEPLPEDLNALWILSPSGTVHLVSAS